MKKVAPLFFGAFFLLAPSFTEAQIRNYPYKVGPISIPGLSNVQLEAEIRNGNYCAIKVFPYGEIDQAETKDVHPFELTEFTTELQAALGALDKTEGSAGSFEKLKDEDVRRLFYYLKGSEYVQPRGSEEPEAGRLCFSERVLVKRTTTDGYQNVLRWALSDRYAEANLEEFKEEHPNVKLKNKDRKSLMKSFRERHEEEIIKITAARYEWLTDSLALLDRELKGFRALRDQVKTIPDTLTQKQIDEQEAAFYKNLGSLPDSVQQQVDVIIKNRNSSLLAAGPDIVKLITDELEPNPAFADRTIQLGSMTLQLIDLYLLNYDNKGAEETIKKITHKIDSLQALRDSIFEKKQSLFNQLAYLSLQIEYIDIEFNEGFIEHILVSGYLDIPDERYPYLKAEQTNTLSPRDSSGNTLTEARTRQRIKFENSFPLGFSRKKDFARLRDYKLRGRAYGDGEEYELRLRDVFEVYLQKHAVGRRDFSPKNTVIRYEPGKKESCIPLYKEETFKLFEARIYSDFVGLDDQASNGLLQTEVAKRMNINTSRRDLRTFNFGGLAWVEPSIAVSKIEKNNKFLPLLPGDSMQLPTAATLDLRRYEAFSVGLNANAYYVDVPGWKSNFMLNLGARGGRTPVRGDTLERGVNTFDFMLEVAADVKADERWGLSFSWQHHFFRLLDRNVRQVGDANDPEGRQFDAVKSNRFQTAQIFLFFLPTEDAAGRLFFRYRYNWEVGDVKLGFHQAQLGYSFYLLGRYKPRDYQEKAQ